MIYWRRTTALCTYSITQLGLRTYKAGVVFEVHQTRDCSCSKQQKRKIDNTGVRECTILFIGNLTYWSDTYLHTTHSPQSSLIGWQPIHSPHFRRLFVAILASLPSSCWPWWLDGCASVCICSSSADSSTILSAYVDMFVGCANAGVAAR